MGLEYDIAEELEAEAFCPASGVDDEGGCGVFGGCGGGEELAVVGDEVDDAGDVVGGVLTGGCEAGVVGAEDGGGVWVCEWGAEDRGGEFVEGDEAGRREFGLARVDVEVGYGRVFGGWRGEEFVNEDAGEGGFAIAFGAGDYDDGGASGWEGCGRGVSSVDESFNA